jgi:hypothetical protein
VFTWDLSVQVDADRDANYRCPKVSPTVRATLDGVPLEVAFRNGTVFDASFEAAGECLPVGFVHVPVSRPTGAARTSSTSSTLIIEDDTTRWTIEVADLMTADLQPVAPLERGTTNAFVWPSAPSIDQMYARVGPYTPRFEEDDGVHWEWDAALPAGTMNVVGNQIAIPVGALTGVEPNAAFAVWGVRSPLPSCDGPAKCEVHVENVYSSSI